jgi:hypothetical protein
MDALRDRADKRDYIFRDYSVRVTSKKVGDEWTVGGELILKVSEELDNEDAVIEVPFEVMVTDDDLGEAVQATFFHLNFISQNFGDAIYEKDFFEILNEAQNLPDDELNSEKSDGGETVLM